MVLLHASQAVAAELACETGTWLRVCISLPPEDQRGHLPLAPVWSTGAREPPGSPSSGEQHSAFCAGFLLCDLYQETWLSDIQCPFVFVFIFLARLMYLKDILSLWFTGIRRGLVQVVRRGPGSPG